VKKIRKRITYANVMSSIAVFLVLGGGAAFAAGKLAKNSVGTKQIKKNAVTSQKIKNGAVTSAKVNVAGFPKVPSAANADNASHANNADNASHANSADTASHANSADTANSVGGSTIRPFFYASNETTTKTTVLTLGSLTLTAGCEGEIPTLVATTSNNNALIHAGGIFEFTHTFYNEDDGFEPGEEINLIETEEPNKSPDSLQGTFTYAQSDGKVITGVFESEESGLDPSEDCVISGQATG
jgi:hypothetical protein